MSAPFPEIHAKSLILLFWHCPMTICVINFKQGMSADALSLIANLKLLPPRNNFLLLSNFKCLPLKWTLRTCLYNHAISMSYNERLQAIN